MLPKEAIDLAEGSGPLHVKHLISVLREMTALERIRISMGPSCPLYSYFTKPHPRFRIIGNKQWGVALLRVPAVFEEYLRGAERQAVRTNRNRAIKLGYTFAEFSPIRQLDDILNVNRSSDERQGHPMPAEYLDRAALEAYFGDKDTVYGVCDHEGKIRAYCYAPVYGEVCVLSRLLGHGDHLKNGVMYFLLSEIIREQVAQRRSTGLPLWFMYDTFFGALPGLRYFKERMGFVPYKVDWTLGDAHEVPRAEFQEEVRRRCPISRSTS